jgi:putative transposase
MNRGNGRANVFLKDSDYRAFTDLIVRACHRIPMRILAHCLMPNHFHLVLWPRGDRDLSRWMQWLLTSHVRRYHRHYETSGRVWQGRFKAFPIQQDGHLLTVLRYVERNPLRANLVSAAEDWEWSSLRARLGRDVKLAPDVGPLGLPPDWGRLVNEPLTPAELEAMRTCSRRGRPYGESSWVLSTAVDLGLVSSLRRRGRPGPSPLEI